MVIVVKNNQEKSLAALAAWLESQGVKIQKIEGETASVIYVLGGANKLDSDRVRAFSAVESVRKISAPYRLASRKFRDENTVIPVGEKRIGEDFCVIAGPCSIESEEKTIELAKAVKKAGADFFRGGAFKPRTSPYTFQGLQKEGLSYLVKAKRETGLKLVSEIVSPEHLEWFDEVDVLQIGARNMQNFELLKAVGKTDKPILLKRGLSATVEEWLLSAEYILAEGNPNVVLCERGIRTFEPSARATLDFSSLPVLKRLTHLPVLVDPSHAAGDRELIEPLSLAGVAAGACGLMIEVHDEPTCALCDGQQAITPKALSDLIEKAKKIRAVIKE